MKCAKRMIEEDAAYQKYNGKHIYLFVVVDDNGCIDYFAKGSNRKVIELNGYAFEKEFKEMCAELGVRCTY